jgi:NADH:ubiquinone oxidoreductase subunit
MSIGTRLYTWLRGELVGSDKSGNRYFREKGGVLRDVGGLAVERRWVIYQGEAEGSKVPPVWHAWLHHTTDAPPLEEPPKRPWIKPHLPNLTGTPMAYRPPGHELSGGHRPKSTGEYEPWRPE